MEFDDATFEEAWTGYCARLWRRGFPRHFIEANAADLFAQAKMEMVVADRKGVEFYSPCGWLITCAWHRTINLVQQQSSRPRRSSLDASVTPPKCEGPTPEEMALAADHARGVHETVGLLSSEDREIIELVYFEEMSCRRAAGILGWSTSKADRRHARALGRLRALCGAKGLGP